MVKVTFVLSITSQCMHEYDNVHFTITQMKMTMIVAQVVATA